MLMLSSLFYCWIKTNLFWSNDHSEIMFDGINEWRLVILGFLLVHSRDKGHCCCYLINQSILSCQGGFRMSFMWNALRKTVFQHKYPRSRFSHWECSLWKSQQWCVDWWEHHDKNQNIFLFAFLGLVVQPCLSAQLLASILTFYTTA